MKGFIKKTGIICFAFLFAFLTHVVTTEAGSESDILEDDLQAQLQVMVDQYDNWNLFNDSKAIFDREYSITVTDIDGNGRLELIQWSKYGNGGWSNFKLYEISEDKHSLNLRFSNYDSEESDNCTPDILKDQVDVFEYEGRRTLMFSDFSREGWMYNNYKLNPMSYMNGKLDTSVIGKKETNSYQDANNNTKSETKYYDAKGKEISEEEYEALPEKIYPQAAKGVMYFKWVKSFAKGAWKGDLYSALEECWKGFRYEKEDTDISAVLLQNLYLFEAGKEVKPEPAVKCSGKALTKDKDYTVEYKNNDKSGQADVIVKGKGKYTGTVEIPYYLCIVSGLEETYEYTGEEIKPEINLTVGDHALQINQDYSLIYENNVEPGPEHPILIVKGTGSYLGLLKIPFLIRPSKIRQLSAEAGTQRELNVKFEDHICADGYIVRWIYQEDEKDGEEPEVHEKKLLMSSMSVENQKEGESFVYSKDEDGNNWGEFHGLSMDRAKHAMIEVCAFAEVEGEESPVLGDFSELKMLPTGNQVIRKEMWGFTNSGLKHTNSRKTGFGDVYAEITSHINDNKGLCDGMCHIGATSVVYGDCFGKNSLQDIKTFEQASKCTDSIFGMNAANAIAYWNELQATRFFQILYSTDDGYDGDVVGLNKLYNAAKSCQNGSGDPVVVGMHWLEDGDSHGHSVLLMGIAEENDDYVKFDVYDPNFDAEKEPSQLVFWKVNGSLNPDNVRWTYTVNQGYTDQVELEGLHRPGKGSFSFPIIVFKTVNQDVINVLKELQNNHNNSLNEYLLQTDYLKNPFTVSIENSYDGRICCKQDYDANINQYNFQISAKELSGDKLLKIKSLNNCTIRFGNNVIDHEIELKIRGSADVSISVTNPAYPEIEIIPVFPSDKNDDEYILNSRRFNGQGAFDSSKYKINPIRFVVSNTPIPVKFTLSEDDPIFSGASTFSYFKGNGILADDGSIQKEDMEEIIPSIDTSENASYQYREQNGSPVLYKSNDGGKTFDEIVYHKHAWDKDYTTDSEATFFEPGKKSIHCKVCDAIKEGSIADIPKRELDPHADDYQPLLVEDKALSSGQKASWGCLWFGSYPQILIVDQLPETEGSQTSTGMVADPDLYHALENAEGWDDHNDIVLYGVKYRRLKSEEAPGRGSLVKSQNGWYYFRYDKIKWRVLDIGDGHALLLSDIALDNQKYHQVSESVTWETSTVRSWLNGYDSSFNKCGIDYSGQGFINDAFTDNEAKGILTTEIDNRTSGTKAARFGGNDTNDKIYFLSEYDVSGDKASSYGFQSGTDVKDEARCGKASLYTIALGNQGTVDDSWWWLRSPGFTSANAGVVRLGGKAIIHGSPVSWAHTGVRPALWLDMESSASWTYAGTNSSDGNKEEKADPDETNQLAAAKAMLMIDQIAEDSDENLVQKARKAYEALDGAQKKLVDADVLIKLTTAEERIRQEKERKNNLTTSIKLQGLSHNIAAGRKIRLSTTVTPKKAKNKALKWTSSNKKVATVSQKGVVSIKPGTGGKTVVIKASATDGSGKTATWSIRVMKGIVKKIKLSGKNKVKAGKALKFKAKVKTTKGANKKLRWISSNTRYATVSGSGKVKTKKAGKGKKVKITAMATDGSGRKASKVIKIK